MRGAVLIVNNIPLGYVKLKGDKTFLAWRTVENSQNKTPMIFSGIYLLTNFLTTQVSCRPLPKGDWGYVNLEKLDLKPMRLVEEPSGSESIVTLRERIIREREKVERMLAKR